MWGRLLVSWHGGSASKNLTKISIPKNLESEHNPVNLLICLVCQRVFLYLWVDEKKKKSFGEVQIGCQVSVLSWKHLYYQQQLIWSQIKQNQSKHLNKSICLSSAKCQLIDFFTVLLQKQNLKCFENIPQSHTTIINSRASAEWQVADNDSLMLTECD